MKQFTHHLGLLILRLAIGGLMLFHGINKVFNGIDGLVGMMSNKGFPGFTAYGVYLGEVIAPIMLIIGFRSKIASLLVAATMLVAIFFVHSADIVQLGKNGQWGIELPMLFLLGSVSIFLLGGGKFSVSSKKRWD